MPSGKLLSADHGRKGYGFAVHSWFPDDARSKQYVEEFSDEPCFEFTPDVPVVFTLWSNPLP